MKFLNLDENSEKIGETRCLWFRKMQRADFKQTLRKILRLRYAIRKLCHIFTNLTR